MGCVGLKFPNFLLMQLLVRIRLISSPVVVVKILVYPNGNTVRPSEALKISAKLFYLSLQITTLWKYSFSLFGKFRLRLVHGSKEDMTE